MANVEHIKEQARGVVIDQIDKRTTDLGNMVGSHVENLRTMSDTLRDQGQGATAGLVSAAAERLNGVSSYLTNTDGNRIVHDIESIARRQPALTGGIGFLSGLLAARLLKASASQRYRAYGRENFAGSSYGTGYLGGETDDFGASDVGIR